MRAVAVALVGAVALALVAGSASCILFTGTSDGYTAAEGGAPSSGCTSSSQCPGQTCCYEVGAGAPSAVCAKSCPASDEVCAVASDCGDGGECLLQSCTVPVAGLTVTVSVTTCGPISFCTQ